MVAPIFIKEAKSTAVSAQELPSSSRRVLQLTELNNESRCEQLSANRMFKSLDFGVQIWGLGIECGLEPSRMSTLLGQTSGYNREQTGRAL